MDGGEGGEEGTRFTARESKEEGRVEEAVGLEQVGYHGKRAQGGATKA